MHPMLANRCFRLTWVAYAEAFVAGSVIEGPVQVDFVTRTGDAERTGIVTT